MSLDYLSIAQQGKNQWWRYLCGIFISLFSFMIVGGIAYGVCLFFLAGNAANFKKIMEAKTVGNFVATNIPFIFWILGTIYAVQVIHARSAWGLISATGKLNWHRVSYGFAVWFAISLIPSVLTLWLSPGEYKFHFDIGEWPLLFMASMVLTPIQTSCEELFFRGYILQGMGLLTRQPLFLIISNGLLFLLPHLGNPEIANGFVWVALQYFSTGVFLAFITLQDNRLELALGVHAANNISHVFFSTTDSALGAPALWMAKPSPAGFTDIAMLLAAMAIAYYLFFYKRLWS
jgi:uncharacterized protein